MRYTSTPTITICYTYTSPMGWLSPDGKFVPCTLTGHRVYALEIYKHFYGEPSDMVQDPHLFAEDHLIKLGWMKLTTENVYPYYCRYTDMYDALTNDQYNAILEWCKANQMDPPWVYKRSLHAHSLITDNY